MEWILDSGAQAVIISVFPWKMHCRDIPGSPHKPRMLGQQVVNAILLLVDNCTASYTTSPLKHHLSAKWLSGSWNIQQIRNGYPDISGVIHKRRNKGLLSSPRHKRLSSAGSLNKKFYTARAKGITNYALLRCRPEARTSRRLEET